MSPERGYPHGQQAARLRAPGAVGPADPGLGVGHPGAGGHPQETQRWGATCAGEKPDPCSSERVV